MASFEINHIRIGVGLSLLSPSRDSVWTPHVSHVWYITSAFRWRLFSRDYFGYLMRFGIADGCFSFREILRTLYMRSSIARYNSRRNSSAAVVIFKCENSSLRRPCPLLSVPDLEIIYSRSTREYEVGTYWLLYWFRSAFTLTIGECVTLEYYTIINLFRSKRFTTNDWKQLSIATIVKSF